MADNIVIVKSGLYKDSVHAMIKFTKKEKNKYTEEMNNYAKSFLKTEFDMDLKIPIEIDGRLTRTGGSFHHYTGRNQATRIKMSERFMKLALLDNDGIEAILDILRHELIHYALYEKGSEGYRDGQKEFEETLARLSVGASGATNKNKVLTQKKTVWYTLQDIYYDDFTGKRYVYNHTKAHQSWVGKRVQYRVIKTAF